jgi:hypothetical protein
MSKSKWGRLLICGRLAIGLGALASWVPAAPVPVPAWITRRFNPETVQVSDVQGISERIRAGKLNLTLKEFLELVLKNSTDINLTRMDVYTAADQVKAAHAVFDPAVSLGFNTLRTTSPQVSQTGPRARQPAPGLPGRAVPPTASSIPSIRVSPVSSALPSRSRCCRTAPESSSRPQSRSHAPS